MLVVSPADAADLTRELARARELYRQGELIAAAAVCDALLAHLPTQPVALHIRGLIELQCGRCEAAADYLRRAIEADPGQALAHSNLSAALLRHQRPLESLASAEAAVRLRPDLTTALYNRACALNALGRHGEALRDYDEVLRLETGNLEARTNRGDALRSLGRTSEAAAAYGQALALAPDFVPALVGQALALVELGELPAALASIARALSLDHHNVVALTVQARALLAASRPEEALAGLQTALELKPSDHAALVGRGNVLRALGRLPEALGSYESALRVEPRDYVALCNRAAILHEQKRLPDAIADYDAALAVQGRDATLLWSRGNALSELGRYEAGIESYQQALVQRPDDPDIHFALGNVLHLVSRNEEAAAHFQRAIDLRPDYPFALGSLLFLRMHCAQWAGWPRAVEDIRAAMGAGRAASFPFPMLSFSGAPRELLQCAQRYAAEVPVPARRALYQGERYQHDRIRVAYLSADFREHPVAHLAAGLFERHDRSRFRVIALSLLAHPAPSAMRERLCRAFDEFHDVAGVSDLAAAELIRALEVDIAIDLTGYTTGGRAGILALRPAPLQVNFLGYPGTLGAPHMDYILADSTVIPEADEPAYVEHVARLPHCYLPNDVLPQGSLGDRPAARRAAGLPESGFVFCAFNNTFKINPGMFDIWMRLLQQVVDSVLWLRAKDTQVVTNLRREAALRGVSPERLVFAPSVATVQEHLARYACADLFLDTLPYNAHATACDALCAGVPVLTCLGESFAGRVAASLLRALDLPELVTHHPEQYEALALQLGSSPAAHAQLRAKLLQHRFTRPLFDRERYRRHLESALQTMWSRHQAGLAPAPFRVDTDETRRS